MKFPLLAFAAIALSAPTHVAQFEIERVLERRAFVAATETGAIANGPDYEVRFDSDGVLVAPVLGARAPQAETLRIDAAHLRRGAHSVPLGSAFPVVVGDRVSYERNSGVFEHFDVQAEGVEQSFVIADKPAGEGDLIISCRLGGTLCDLAVPSEAGGLLFERSHGGVRVGAVTAIDAAGSSQAGELRVHDSKLELVVPEQFVESAVWPLLIDPLIGSSFSLTTTANDDASPEVCFDDTNNVYLIVWKRTFSATSFGIRAQRFGPTGNPLGTFFAVATNGAILSAPKVANLQSTNRFLVAWTESGAFASERLIVRSIPADGSAMSATESTALAVGGSIVSFDLAGEASGNPIYDDAIVVWHETGNTEGILAKTVQVPASGDPVAGSENLLVDNSGLFFTSSDPSISRTGGFTGTFLIAYLSNSFFAGDKEIAAFPVDRSANPTAPTLLLTSNSVDELAPVVDGGASHEPRFVVLYEREPIATLRELELTAVRVAGGAASIIGSSVVHSSLAATTSYDVAWTPGIATVAWTERNIFFGTVFVHAQDFDAFTAAPCRPRETVASFTPSTGGPKVAVGSVASGGRVGRGEGLVLFGYEGTTNGDIFGQRFDAHPGGSTLDLGGECGQGGTIVPQGDPALGNAWFQLTLVGADPSAQGTLFNVGPQQTPFTCGPCVWNSLGNFTALPLLNGGNQNVLVIPCDIALAGQSFQAQYTTVTSNGGACPNFAQFSISNRLRVTIGS